MRTSSQSRVAQAIGTQHGWRVWIVVLAALVAFAAAFSVHAQPVVDPPSRVARLSEASGQIWLFNTDTNEWVTIARNRPLTTGDRIATDNGARAEITLGSTTLRLDAATELEIVRLDDTRFALRLHGGSVAARLRTPQSFAEFELSTDEGRFRAQTVGRFRFDRVDQASDVTAFAGQAIYENRNTALPVTTGQHAQFWIDQAGVPQYALVQVTRDEFAAWNDDRDRAEDRAVAQQQRRYVSPEMTGAEDLDRYGTWEQTPEYGALWVPRQVPVGWAPYSVGHWAWVRPWGWTWVDDAPWGFAPFHYGRWVYRRDVWCWAPGTYVARPVYAPALVAWLGGPSVSVSITVGGGAPVGWVPLAPREVYVPPYRYSQRYVREVNITHVTNVTNITTIVNNRNGELDRRDLANRKFPNAVTVVPQEVMLRRQPVAPVAERLRNDPQVRSLVADSSPPRTVTAPPVSAPPPAQRPSSQVRPPRPPFEGRAPGFAGRPEATRPPGAVEPQRTDPRAGTAPPRAEVGVPPPRSDGARPPDYRGGRPEFGRGNERGGPPVATTPNAAVAPAQPHVGAAPAPGPTTTAPGATPGSPPVGARGVLVEPSTRPPTRGGAPNESVASPPRSEAVAPPSPVQRSAPPNEGGRPVHRNREAADDDRGGPKQAMPPPSRISAPRDVAPPAREPAPAIRETAPPARATPPRMNRPPEAAVAPPPVQRPPAAGAAPQVAPAAPPQAQRAPAPAPQAAPPAPRPPAEHKMTRPEPPGKEERRDERQGGEKQR